MQALAEYGSDGSSEGADDTSPRDSSLAARLLPPRADDGAASNSSSSSEDVAEAEEALGAGGERTDAAMAPVAPSNAAAAAAAAVLHAGESDDGDGDGEGAAAAAAAEPQPTLELPPPDLADFDPSTAGTAAAPRVSALGKQKRGGGGGGPATLSKGFTAAVTRHDQLRAAAARAREEELEARGRNNGLSSAYDSVFRGGGGGDEAEGARRTKVTRKGTVRTMSKKEAAEEDALLASLQ